MHPPATAWRSCSSPRSAKQNCATGPPCCQQASAVGTLVSDIERILGEAFENRVLPFDTAAARAYADIAAKRPSIRRPSHPLTTKLHQWPAPAAWRLRRAMFGTSGTSTSRSSILGRWHDRHARRDVDPHADARQPRRDTLGDRTRPSRLLRAQQPGFPPRCELTMNPVFGVTRTVGLRRSSAPTGSCPSNGFPVDSSLDSIRGIAHGCAHVTEAAEAGTVVTLVGPISRPSSGRILGGPPLVTEPRQPTGVVRGAPRPPPARRYHAADGRAARARRTRRLRRRPVPGAPPHERARTGSLLGPLGPPSGLTDNAHSTTGGPAASALRYHHGLASRDLYSDGLFRDTCG